MAVGQAPARLTGNGMDRRQLRTDGILLGKTAFPMDFGLAASASLSAASC